MSCNSNKFIHVARHCGLRLRLRSCHGLLSLASYRTRWHSRRENKNMCSHATQLSWTLGQISHQLNLNAMIHHINGLSWLDVSCRGGWVGGHGGAWGLAGPTWNNIRYQFNIQFDNTFNTKKHVSEIV